MIARLQALKPSPGAIIFFACLLIPLTGCFLAVAYHNTQWLILLAPLIVFMEGGCFSCWLPPSSYRILWVGEIMLIMKFAFYLLALSYLAAILGRFG